MDDSEGETGQSEDGASIGEERASREVANRENLRIGKSTDREGRESRRVRIGKSASRKECESPRARIAKGSNRERHGSGRSTNREERESGRARPWSCPYALKSGLRFQRLRCVLASARLFCSLSSRATKSPKLKRMAKFKNNLYSVSADSRFCRGVVAGSRSTLSSYATAAINAGPSLSRISARVEPSSSFKSLTT